jgi:hypothetical protein
MKINLLNLCCKSLFLIWLIMTSGLAQTESNQPIPELPFADNPDPNLCGIPEPWTSDAPAWLSGYYQGQLIQPIVFLYDSHLRRSITGQAASGSQVTILLSQSNPSLNYYLVRTTGDNPQEGWIPEPFLSFDQSD